MVVTRCPETPAKDIPDMGNHRAERRAPRRVASTTPVAPISETVSSLSGSSGGKRRAGKPSRTGFGPKLPSSPVLMGITALALSAGGALTAGGGGTVLDAAGEFTYASQVSAFSGASNIGQVTAGRRSITEISRDSARDAQTEAADSQLQEAVEAQAQERDAALSELAAAAQQQARKIEKNQWVLPVIGYHLTARFGEYGLWSSYHTGLDFAAGTGTPIYAVSNGVITSTAYDGAYGNKTVETLEDGTELWYCHQNAFNTTPGTVVHAGDLIGYIGSTGHVTGPHLHLEVRPGAGDPVDPYAALVAHGVTP
jgi:murein DD-endopeptidase MepM/ murein hydrolase activator NlpD